MPYEGKYFVIEITKFNNGVADTQGIYPQTTENDAIRVYYQKLSAAIGNPDCSFELCQIINEYGVIIKTEYFERADEAAE